MGTDMHRRVVTGGVALSLAVALTACGSAEQGEPAQSSDDQKVVIGIVEQQLGNPFFGAIQQAATDAAESEGAEVIVANSKVAGDSESQVNAIHDMINRGVAGIVLDPANAAAVVPAVQQAREAGILVVTVNTQVEPASAADAGFETDNKEAGRLIGAWAKASLGDGAANVAMLDYDLTDKTSKSRHDGFLEGFGLTDDSPEIVAQRETSASVDGGQNALENMLQANKDINVVYAINEPMAQGGFAAAKAQGLAEDILFTAIDGSCSGVQAVRDGEIGATVAQFPTRMGQLAVEAILKYHREGVKPSGISNSGTVLITDSPVEGIESKDTAWGLENCWGEQ
ncbi:substrate-binding domain-containing protein [Propionibacterium australiense]|uniref:Periplasmic binding protein domain n=1 Tax=Propionibacterium australiense TaxID=119981 RepID=A0A383S5B5_9ACTN|nr:substrate-binding domain-containing protein [Propionibacterium australiense]RLP09719.1 sugar ABC transporter substrate-binding protein [Propionibacterium australiense]RLP10224.1 sugar ABC transporter substrate-binding protein [Propionibacterium australiense]SYZ33185.1 Periplasmic binding protein domain [Propionibacterium australiense]VEH89372.1 D-ribose-binding periplasmic protein precursor [Propionibacterium australiense]